jgi:hypothetical protein
MGWEDDDAKQCREGEGVSFADDEGGGGSEDCVKG